MTDKFDLAVGLMGVFGCLGSAAFVFPSNTTLLWLAGACLCGQLVKNALGAKSR